MLVLLIICKIAHTKILSGIDKVIGSGYPHLGAGLPLTPAEEAVADRAAARSAAMAAAAKF